MLWLNLSLALLVVALALTVVLSGRPVAWPRARPFVLLALQLAGVLLVTWWLVSEGGSALPSTDFTPVAPPDPQVELRTALADAWRSL